MYNALMTLLVDETKVKEVKVKSCIAQCKNLVKVGKCTCMVILAIINIWSCFKPVTAEKIDEMTVMTMREVHFVSSINGKI